MPASQLVYVLPEPAFAYDNALEFDVILVTIFEVTLPEGTRLDLLSECQTVVIGVNAGGSASDSYYYCQREALQAFGRARNP